LINLTVWRTNFLDNESKTPALFCLFILFEMSFRNCSCPLSFLESGYACPAFYKAPVATKAIQNVPKLGSESFPGRMKKLFPSWWMSGDICEAFWSGAYLAS
jgi:hypothetical protein